MNFPLEVKILLSMVLYLSLFRLMVRGRLIDASKGPGKVLYNLSGWMVLASYVLAAVCIWRFL